jgi:hypothetical protein
MIIGIWTGDVNSSIGSCVLAAYLATFMPQLGTVAGDRADLWPYTRQARSSMPSHHQFLAECRALRPDPAPQMIKDPVTVSGN